MSSTVSYLVAMAIGLAGLGALGVSRRLVRRARIIQADLRREIARQTAELAELRQLVHELAAGLERVRKEVGEIGGPSGASATAAAEPSPELAPPPVVATRRRARILVVDDEPLIGRTLVRSLPGHDVRAVDSGRAAVELCRTETFDLVLCDMMMPDLSGIDVYEALLAQDPALAARIVMMTGGVFTARGREFLARAHVPLLEKPLDLAALRALVDRMLAGRDDRQ